MRGAGGTEGGVFRFFIGLVMLIGGGYLFLNALIVTHRFSLGYGIFHVGGMNVTTGMVLIPFIFGVCVIFYNSRNILGWILAIGSMVMLMFGVISSVNFRFRHMTAFELLSILVLVAGGLGLFLSSLKNLGGDDL